MGQDVPTLHRDAVYGELCNVTRMLAKAVLNDSFGGELRSTYHENSPSNRRYETIASEKGSAVSFWERKTDSALKINIKLVAQTSGSGRNRMLATCASVEEQWKAERTPEICFFSVSCFSVCNSVSTIDMHTTLINLNLQVMCVAEWIHTCTLE